MNNKAQPKDSVPIQNLIEINELTDKNQTGKWKNHELKRTISENQ